MIKLIIISILLFTLLFIFWNVFTPLVPNKIIKGCSGKNCKGNKCVGRGCNVLPCIGDFCTAGDCIGEDCHAGDCYGYNCTAGNCYGAGCIPGKCMDTTCHSNNCPQSSKTCHDGSFYKIKMPWYWSITRYFPTDSLLNPPLCYKYLTIKDFRVKEKQLRDLGVVEAITSGGKILNIDQIIKDKTLSENDIIIFTWQPITKNANCDIVDEL